ncbi:hypothetical protein [Lentilactobacillus sunkii]|uniref:hypothetical protein n=1 Tax=Lentilactobacillus sunkii TaxID=481719 RepID=UPI00159F6D33|nr:hypothetical protein [Lentilactobacillus sunkii]
MHALSKMTSNPEQITYKKAVTNAIMTPMGTLCYKIVASVSIPSYQFNYLAI